MRATPPRHSSWPTAAFGQKSAPSPLNNLRIQKEMKLYHYTDENGAEGIKSCGNLVKPFTTDDENVVEEKNLWATKIPPKFMLEAGLVGSLCRLTIGGGYNFDLLRSWPFLRKRDFVPKTRCFEFVRPKDFKRKIISRHFLKVLCGQSYHQGPAEASLVPINREDSASDNTHE